MICIEEYVRYIEGELKRLETINKYLFKMNNSKKEKDKTYFSEIIKSMLSPGENIDNLDDIYKEYEVALKAKNDAILKLLDEIKIIKKLRV